MIGVLWKKEWKSGRLLFGIFSAVLALYILMITSMFDPKLGESLELMTKSMPQLFAAFGMEAPGTTLLDFLVNYLYGFLLTVFPLVLLVLLVKKMMIRYLEEGSMAYLLATPNSRGQIAVTQAAGIVSFLLALLLFVTLLEIAASEALFPGQLEIGKLLWVNGGLFTLWLFLSGLCFLCACLFAEGRLGLAFGAGLPVLFLLLQMISQVGEKFEWLKYATPMTLFSPEKLALGEAEGMVGAAVLLGAGILSYMAGVCIFRKRDLSL